MPTRTIAYLRVSTDKQADRGVSLDAQRAKLKAYAELYELDLVEIIVDAGQSAKSLDRPGLQRALGMLKGGEADALLVVKVDRLTRSVADLGALVERYFAPGKAALLSVGEKIDTRSAAGRLVLNVLASVTQWDREAIGERTAMAMQHQTPGQEGGAGDGGSARFPNGSVIYLRRRLQRGRAPEAARAEVRAGSDRRGPGLRHRPAAGRLRGREAAVADYRGTIVLTGTPGNLIKGLFFDVTNGREPEQSRGRPSGGGNEQGSVPLHAEDLLPCRGPGGLDLARLSLAVP